MVSAEVLIRRMRPADLPAVFELQCQAYPAAYHESVAALASRQQAGGSFCFVAERAGELLAYLFAHPWQGHPPALHQPLQAKPDADHLFLHDLAVAPHGRGLGLGARLHAASWAAAQSAGLGEVRLVALAPAQPFWRRLAYQPQPAVPLDAGYGCAQAMCRTGGELRTQ